MFNTPVRQAIFDELQDWMKSWAEDFDPNLDPGMRNPPVDGMGVPILDLIPTKNPSGPTLRDFMATFDSEDEGGFFDLFDEKGEPEETIPELLRTPLTSIWYYPPPHGELHTAQGEYEEGRL
jgi:hypothetical protein